MDRWKEYCSRLSFLLVVIISIFFFRGAVSVVVTEVLLAGSEVKPYVLQGEPATIICHYFLEDSELVTEVEWEKDGVLVYLWMLDNPPEAKDVLEGKVDTTVTSPAELSITKTHMDMDGTYTCRVRTNGKTAQNEMYLMVIVDACDDSSWKTHSDMVECTETINMHCYGIFPKPSPACGVYSEKTGKYLNSVPFDSVNKLFNGTYEVSFNRRFVVQDWLNHTDISFRCYMIVLGTPWRSGIKHNMFGDPGCEKNPPLLTNGYYNMTGGRSCYNYPSDGSVVEYHCDDGYILVGSPVYTCTDGQWTPNDVIVDEDDEVPVCNELNAGKIISGQMSLMLVFVLYFCSNWMLFP